jgi:type I restriction enzyme S subunit
MTPAAVGKAYGRVRSDWPIRHLPDVAFYQEGPGLRKWQWTNCGMKVINGTNILETGEFDVGNTNRYISLGEFQRTYSHFAVEAGDIVVASSGTIGKVGRVRSEHLPLMMNTSVIRFHAHDRAVLDDEFLYAYLRSPADQVSGGDGPADLPPNGSSIFVTRDMSAWP